MDADRMVLTVEPPTKCLEPDSPLSTDPLIGPQSPDYPKEASNLRNNKAANMSASAESLDKLLSEEEAKNKCSFPFNNIFTFQGAASPAERTADQLLGGACAPPEASHPDNASARSRSPVGISGNSAEPTVSSPQKDTSSRPMLYENWPVSKKDKQAKSSKGDNSQQQQQQQHFSDSLSLNAGVPACSIATDGSNSNEQDASML